jgi:hypothetical protein
MKEEEEEDVVVMDGSCKEKKGVAIIILFR